jgi:hypothetical protein
VTSDPLHEAAAEGRVQAALEALDEARRCVEQAGQALCPVKGFGKEWERLGDLDEKLRSQWYRVRRRRDRVRSQGLMNLERDQLTVDDQSFLQAGEVSS